MERVLDDESEVKHLTIAYLSSYNFVHVNETLKIVLYSCITFIKHGSNVLAILQDH